MSLNLAVAQRAQYFDNDGVPLSQGRVTFYEVGSSTILKSIYADPDGVTPLDSQLLLDIGGFVPATGVFYEAGNYSIKVERRTNPEGVVPEYALNYFMPNVPGSSVSSALNTSRIVYVESVEAMANLVPNSYDYVYCFNYYTSNIDNGGGWFRWVPSSTATTDLGMVFSLSASANGRNFRMYDGNVKSSYYGVIPNRSVNMGSRIAQASIWAVAKSETLELVSGEIEIDGTITVQSCDVQINAGFSFDRLTALTTSVLRFNLCNVNVLQVNEDIAVSTDSTHYVQFEGDENFKLYPAWWGAVGNNTTDDYSAFTASTNSDGVHQIVKGYKLTGVTAPTLTLESVHLVDNGFINNNIISLTINACSSTENAYNNFRATSGDFANYIFNFVGYAKWFFDTTCSDTQLSTLRTALTSKNLIWDRPTTYTLSPLVDNNQYFVNQVRFGTLLNFTSKINIGLIDAGQYKIFAETSLAPGYLNEKVLGAWFGVSKFSSNAVNEAGIKNAIEASEDCTVDFGGGKVQVGTSVSISANTDNVTIKNLFVEVNGSAAPALIFTNSSVEIIDSQIEGVETDATCNISLNNCKMIFSNVAQGVTLLGVNVSVKNCEFGSSTWIGLLNVSGTDRTIFDNNTVEGGYIEIYIGAVSRLNSISDNHFDKIKRIGTGTGIQTYLKVTGGDRCVVNDNIFYAINNPSSIGIFNQLLFRGYNNTDIVTTLVCTGNSFYAEMISSPAISAENYADDGHIAKVYNNVVSANQGTARTTLVEEKGATSTTAAIEYTINRFIFPFHPSTSIPYFSGTTWTVGNSTAGTPSYFAGEIISYTPSGGEASVRIKYRAENFGTLNNMALVISVEAK
jgi:hypothetical protein